MYIVYREASANLVYLGEDDGNAAAAVQAIMTLDREVRVETDDYRRFQDMVRSDAGMVAVSPQAKVP